MPSVRPGKAQIAEGQGKGDAVVIAALASDDGQILVAERGPRYRPRDTGIYGEPSSAIGRDDPMGSLAARTKRESTTKVKGVQCASFGTDAIALPSKESIDF
jgi:hypothetical protein